jgi:Fe-S cluster assembly protein SufD
LSWKSEVMTGSEVKVQGQELFHKRLEELYASENGEGPLFKVQTRAWDRFLQLGLPSRKTGEFQYMPLHKLYAQSFSLPSLRKLSKEKIAPFLPAGSFAVFYNGRFCSELSHFASLPKKAVAIPMNDAFRAFSSHLNNQSLRSLAEETDSFAALNGALATDALFVYLPPNVELEIPIHILHFVDEADCILSPRVELFCGALSSAKISLQTIYLASVETLINGSLHISLEEGASAQYERKSFDLPEGIWEMHAVRASMKRDSRLKTLSSTQGAEGWREDYKVWLAGENAEAQLAGCWMLDGKNEAHTHVKVDHQAPNCRSNQLFKGVLGGSSRSSFEGKIYVHQEAQKTEAFQMNQNLLLSQGAQANSKPNLEIFADDVKASHGATVGQINAEELFYLQTRGLSQKESKKLLIQGFCAEVMDRYAFIK